MSINTVDGVARESARNPNEDPAQCIHRAALDTNGILSTTKLLADEDASAIDAHAIGHKLLHPGNHMWMRMHTGLGNRLEREAEDFAHALCMDAQEAVNEGLVAAWEIAEHFGVPEELVKLQAPLARP